MNKSNILAILLILVGGTVLAEPPAPDDNNSVPESVKAGALPNNDTGMLQFTHEMYNVFAEKDRENFLFSPFSIRVCMGVLALGAKPPHGIRIF